jgi:hypothetical protein
MIMDNIQESADGRCKLKEVARQAYNLGVLATRDEFDEWFDRNNPLPDEYGKEHAIDYADWVADSGWEKHPDEENLWYLPSNDITIQNEEKSANELYAVFKRHRPSNSTPATATQNPHIEEGEKRVVIMGDGITGIGRALAKAMAERDQKPTPLEDNTSVVMTFDQLPEDIRIWIDQKQRQCKSKTWAMFEMYRRCVTDWPLANKVAEENTRLNAQIESLKKEFAELQSVIDHLHKH